MCSHGNSEESEAGFRNVLLSVLQLIERHVLYLKIHSKARPRSVVSRLQVNILVKVIKDPVIPNRSPLELRFRLFQAHGLHRRNSRLGGFVILMRNPAFRTQTQHFLRCLQLFFCSPLEIVQAKAFVLLLVALEGDWTWSNSIGWGTRTNVLPFVLDKDQARHEGDVVALPGRTRQLEYHAPAD